MSLPHTTPGVWPARSPGKLAAWIRDDLEGCAVALVGFPADTGVRLNRGRPGAAAGPSAFRAALARYGTDWDQGAAQKLATIVGDAGDVELPEGEDEATLELQHARVWRAVASLHERGLVTVGIGGGHDLTFPAVAGMQSVRSPDRPVGGVNLDAHLDVRPTPGSGMPFRRLIETRSLDGEAFVELGIGRFANASDHADWLTGQGGTIVLDEDVLAGRYTPEQALEHALADGREGFVTIDLDGIDGASAPGVSAVNPMGLTVAHAVSLVRAAGRHPRVHHLDLMELCPRHDLDGRTARVAALLFLHFLSAFAEREGA